MEEAIIRKKYEAALKLYDRAVEGRIDQVEITYLEAVRTALGWILGEEDDPLNAYSEE